MEIKNLAQLKRAINDCKEFVILQHFIKPEYTGQIRRPTTVQTNGFYSAAVEDIESGKPLSNFGKGIWIEYGKASEWKFENGECYYAKTHQGMSKPIWKISFL